MVPAIGMRLWAEERKSGTIELLLTLPIPIWASVAGKFLAAWVFTGVALSLTFPIWITVNYLGDPDNGVIVASYIGSFLMAGAYLAISAAISALTSNQVIAFVVSVVICFLFTISGAPLVIDFFKAWAPLALVDTVSSFSFMTHFQTIARGVIDLRDIVFFFSLIALFLGINVVIVDLKKAG
ncbi:MAG: ABC transporter permease subunit [Micropepsaceae bacterium]